jgi:hypothetical protein
MERGRLVGSAGQEVGDGLVDRGGSHVRACASWHRAAFRTVVNVELESDGGIHPSRVPRSPLHTDLICIQVLYNFFLKKTRIVPVRCYGQQHINYNI